MAFDEAVARGSDALKQGQLEVAQQQFRAALAIDPDSVRVLALLGLSYFRGNEFGNARPIYEELVERAPTDASHRLNLGLVYLKLNDAVKAINALEASRALDPSQGRAVAYLGLAYARAGRYVEAYRSFLLAGQNELATEVEVNLTSAERDGIQAQIGRTPTSTVSVDVPPIAPRGLSQQLPVTPATPVTPSGPIPVAVAHTPSEPRTKPPSAPPRGRGEAASFESGSFESGMSHPEIVIESTTGPISKIPMTVVHSGASNVDASQFWVPNTPMGNELRMTESQLFVLPKPDAAVPKAVPGMSMVSSAVAAAAPAPVPAVPRTRSGGLAPRPLSELATVELLRPEDGTDALEISASGALIIRITDRTMTRLEGVHITGGDLAYDVATRRSRGHQTEEQLDYGGTLLHVVSGHGYLVAIPGKNRVFSAVSLDDDILYMREDLVFAFESTLRWESGNVPGLRGKLPVLQFRGDGALAICTERPLVRVKLTASGVVFIDAHRLAGWIGRVIPRAVTPPSGGPMGATCIECTGEGIVLVEPAPDPALDIIAMTSPPPPCSTLPRSIPPAPPPAVEEPPPPAAIDPDLDMSSVFAEDPPAENSDVGPDES